MNKINMGGPAFPSKKRVYIDGYLTKEFEPVDGMTLRDYFAAKAMPLAWKIYDEGYSMNDVSSENIAKVSYQLADAMLKAREM